MKAAINMKIIFLALSFFSTAFAEDAFVSTDELMCPKVGEIFLSNGKKTLSSMQDLLNTTIEKRQKQNEFYLTLMDLKKENPEHEQAASQIKEIEKGIGQKLSRAKENYNNELKTLAVNLPKARKCWSHHPAEIKDQIGNLLELFQVERILTNYKACITILNEANKNYNNQYSLSIKYFHKEISKYKFVSEAKKDEERIKKYKSLENKACTDFIDAKGRYYSFLQGDLTKKIVKSKDNKNAQKEKAPRQAPMLPGIGESPLRGAF